MKATRKFLFSVLAVVCVLTVICTASFATTPAASDNALSAQGTVQTPTPTPTTLSTQSSNDASSANNSTSASTSSTTTSSSTTDATEQKKAQAQAEDAASGAGTTYVAGEVLVVYQDGVSADTASQVLQNTDVVDTKTVSQDDLDETTPVTTAKVSETSSVQNAAATLSQDPDVKIAQPNYIYTLCDETTSTTTTSATGTSDLTTQSSTINDPYATSLYQLKNIGCYEAWDYARCDHKVGVAVIDTGCNVDHEDLAKNVAGAYNSVDKTTDVTDNDGHGTHVAGIIGAVTNNGVGVSGVSYNANVIPVKAFTDSKNRFESAGLLEAYNYIIKNKDTYNIRVVNMSLGGGGGCSPDDALLEQVDKAYSDGILTVCAAGNQDTRNGLYPPYAEYPGDYTTCVSVINTNSSNTISGSSNYNVAGTTEGDFGKNICAPGTSIYSTISSGYGYVSGTSMASPVVAGVAALVFSADESLTPAQVKSTLYSTATDLGDSGWDCTYGYGLVNAAAAVESVTGTTPKPIVTATLSDDETTATCTLENASSLASASSVSFPVWSDSGGQDDIVWYQATKGSDGNWTVSVPISEHRSTGSYEAHCYVTVGGSTRWVGADAFTVTAPKATLKVTDVNADAGTYTVTASGINCPSGVSSVSMPTWTESGGQDDIVWNQATDNGDGTWSCTVPMSAHGLQSGAYDTHCYVYGKNGTSGWVGAVSQEMTSPKVTVDATLSADETTATCTLRNAASLGLVSSVTFPVWSDSGGQDDIVWYQATKGSDGNWTASVPISAHRSTGSYEAHCYVTVGGSTSWVGADTFTLTAPKATLKVTSTNTSTGTYTVTASGINCPSGVSSVSMPTWTEAGGQDDIVWNQATDNGDGTWSCTVSMSDHNWESGTYDTHCYVYGNNGTSGWVGAVTQTM